MPTLLVLIAMLGSTLCYGTAAVLQARAVRAGHNDARLDPRFFVGLMRQPSYLLALAVSAVGFISQLPALRTFPLFVVQTAQAANLAVAAIVAIPVLNEHLRIRDWLAVVAVVAGLWLLLVSISVQHSVPGKALDFSLLPWTILLAAVGYAAQRVQGTLGGAIAAFTAGLGFGTVGVSVRSVQDSSLTSLLLDPAMYALIASGALAFLLYAVALDRSTVAVATTALIAAQIGGSAVVGTAVLGDRTRPGYGLTAVLGLTLVVVGAISLVRFAQLSKQVTPSS